MSETTRRAVLAGAAGIGAATALAACGDSDAAESPAPGGAATSAAPPTTGAAPTSAAAGAGAGIATADIPVGSGKIFKEQKVVITQPTAGSFKAFNVACPHQGCPVSQITPEAIVCVCHNSKFGVADGAVLSGPSQKPLAPLKVTVNGDKLIVG